jgi:multidrug efflux pump subunit AcrA (membrane-fusion protein)
VLALPANCLLFRPEGPYVVLRDTQGIATFRTVTLGRDFGTWVEMLSGVRPEDSVVVSPPDSLAEGTVLTPAADPEAPGSKSGG